MCFSSNIRVVAIRAAAVSTFAVPGVAKGSVPDQDGTPVFSEWALQQLRFWIFACAGTTGQDRVRPQKNNRAERRGFSLVELMVVIVIIGLLAGAVTISVRSYMAAARKNLAKSEISSIVNALEMFYSIEKKYPTAQQGIDVLIQPSPNMVDGYLKNKSLNDPWGNAYQYFIPGPDGEPFEVVSYGADGREGGINEDQDISSTLLDKN